MHFLRERGKAVWVVLTKCFLPLSSLYIHHQEFHLSIPRGVFPPPPFPLIAGVAKSPLSPFPLTVLSRKSLERKKKKKKTKRKGKRGALSGWRPFNFPLPNPFNKWMERRAGGFFARKKGETDVFKYMCLFYSAKKRFWTKFSGIKTVIW